VLAAISGLAAPPLIGQLVQEVDEGTTRHTSTRWWRQSPLFLLVQTVLTRYARYLSFRLGEKVLADLREDFVRNALALPVGTVERAGDGDLLTRGFA
jgi:ABC-type multidrug transport system fused ATPase/permease subunit